MLHNRNFWVCSKISTDSSDIGSAETQVRVNQKANKCIGCHLSKDAVSTADRNFMHVPSSGKQSSAKNDHGLSYRRFKVWRSVRHVSDCTKVSQPESPAWFPLQTEHKTRFISSLPKAMKSIVSQVSGPYKQVSNLGREWETRP